MSFHIPPSGHVPPNVEADAFKAGRRETEAKAARYAQLHADDPPREHLSAIVRRIVRRMRAPVGRRS